MVNVAQGLVKFVSIIVMHFVRKMTIYCQENCMSIFPFSLGILNFTCGDSIFYQSFVCLSWCSFQSLTGCSPRNILLLFGYPQVVITKPLCYTSSKDKNMPQYYSQGK